MGIGGQILGGVGQGREREGTVDGLDAEALASLGLELNVGAVLMVAAVLRTGIVDILLRDGRLPQADGAGLLAIGIVVPWSTTVPRQLLVFARQFDEDTQTGNLGQTIGNGEREGQFVALLLGSHRDAQRVESTAFPVLGKPIAEALVVVGGGTENLR